MSQGPLCPNLTKKVQKEVFQIANRNLPSVMLLGGLSVNLNHLISVNLNHLKRINARRILAKEHSGLNWPLFDFMISHIFKRGGDLPMFFNK